MDSTCSKEGTLSTTLPAKEKQPLRKKVTTHALREKKELGEPISMLTAYDYPTALAMDQAILSVWSSWATKTRFR